uniref:Uncharacterized protein n=1 Tax=Kalanchoe fedtschenkoi TaxID=63787 RepID=A0A7N0T036_KALFE
MQAPGVNTDQFDLYFRRADLDGDGRISGAEAVSFFQGSNLPKHVLAQIWMHADQNRIGFLGRQEFYNALRLVTVAQSKRDLTPDIVKAALFGPAAAKIPAPQINLAAVSGPPPGRGAAPHMPQTSTMQAPPPQSGFRGQAPSNMGVPSQTVKPPQQMPVTSNMGAPSQTMRPPQQMPITSNTGIPSPQTMRPSQPLQSNSNMGFPGQPNQSVGLSQSLPATSGLGIFSQPNQTMRPSQSVPATLNMGLSSQQNQTMGPSQPMPGTSSMHPQNQGLGRGGTPASPSTTNFGMSNTWVGGNPLGAPSTRGISPQIPSAITKPLDFHLSSSQPASTPKSSAASGSGLQSGLLFGNDSFSAAVPKQEPAKPDPLALLYSSSPPTSSAIVPVATAPQPPPKARSLDSLQTALTMQPVGGPIHRTQSLTTPNPQFSAQSTSSPVLSGSSVGVGGSASPQGQLTWPKMKPSDVQKYTKVFMEVDTDRDGKITGEQARSLFLSWRLPREVLKQVWDLSDQDNDSMLSAREFCIALYLMERYREGRPLPSALPTSILFDETLMTVAGQPPASFGTANWGQSPVMRPQQGLPGSQMPPTAGPRPSVPYSTAQTGGLVQQPENKPKEIAEEDPFASFGTGKPKSQDNRGAKDSEQKVEVSDKAIMDSKEKMEFYRTMMQELVLYKSRCDNRLNEITERALADKREAESLGKKYEEKYKQVAELHSKLTIEEAKYRDVQERKTELQQALIKMEQGGSADGILQVRADRIQSDVDELMKGLTERCKKHKLNVKSAALFEMPRGWQPGIQENAVVWDEEWDKFEDEGFSFANEYNLDKQNNTASPKTKSTQLWEENDSPKSTISDSASTLDAKSEKLFHANEHSFDTESTYDHGHDDWGRNFSESPSGRSTLESPRDRKADDDGISFDDSNWGNFDNNDDVDSVWGFNPASSKDFYSENKEDYFFGSESLNPIKTESPQSDAYPSQSPFVFADSVASTPHSTYGGEVLRGGFFDQSSRFDSFSVRDESSPRKEAFSRFDSMNSTSGFGHSRAFTSFDDADPFGSTGPFKVSSSETPRKDSKDWNNF